MDLVLSGLQWSQCLNDIIVLGRSFGEHIKNLDSVFQRLRQSGLRLKPSKHAFFRKEVRYLDQVISRDVVPTDPDKTAKVATWPEPTTKRETRQFLGFASYYRRLLRDFAQIARPLHRLTEKTACSSEPPNARMPSISSANISALHRCWPIRTFRSPSSWIPTRVTRGSVRCCLNWMTRVESGLSPMLAGC